MIIKVCGMREEENIRQVEQLGVDLLGFIFYPKSPRYVTSVPGYLSAKAKKVGVFVNESYDTIMKYTEKFSFDYIQLHGNESPDFCYSLCRHNIHIIKAFSISEQEDLKLTESYNGICDYYLFDTKTGNYGGSGKRFDWNILSHYQANSPFILSGGISMDNMDILRSFTHPRLAGYDINSCFEIYPGMKDVSKINNFLQELSIK